MCNCNRCSETEDENNFWADVYYHMETQGCDRETAIEEISKLYKEKCIF